LLTGPVVSVVDGDTIDVQLDGQRVRDDGRPERVFLQEELFGPEEYRQIVAYHYGMARHHLFKAQTYRDHAKARYGVQLPLFGEDDGEI
jgi:endonuclease YncB( thermonuclease family)